MSEALLRPDDWEQPVEIPDLGELSSILVPFDGSHTAERALAWAALLAAGASTEVIVMVAYEPPLTKKGRGALYVEEIRDALEHEARLLAGEAVTMLEARGCRARGIVVRGEPAAASIDTATDEGSSLIVLGRRGLTSELGGLAGSMERVRAAVTGGVAEKVARHADVAVMVV